MELISVWIPYIVPALLGRSYNLRNESVGPDLFTVEEANKAMTIQKHVTTVEYRIVTETSEARDFLDVNGALALKLGERATVSGDGGYLKEDKNMEKKVNLLVRCRYATIVKTLSNNVKPIPRWKDYVKDETHYVRSVEYGGELIASVEYTCNSNKDKEKIVGTVSGELNSKSGSFGAGLKAALEKAQEKIGDSAKVDINYYATVPLGDIPRSIEGMVDLVQNFPNATKAVNKGFGVPLRMEAISLQVLDSNRTTYYQTLSFQGQLTIVNEQCKDSRAAWKKIADILQPLPPLSDEANAKIGKFCSNLEKINRICSEVIAKLDLSPEADASQFKPVFDAYLGDRKEAMPNMYLRDAMKLRDEVLADTPSLKGDFGGKHYTHWGADTCPPDTVLEYKGVMSTTDRSSIGSSQFTCMPDEKQYPDDKPSEDDEKGIDDYPQVQQVAFITRKKGGDQKQKTVKCARCRVPGKSTVTTMNAQIECPKDWKKLYQGVLISTDYQQVRGELVCLDTNKSFENVPSDSEDLTVVTEVSPQCGVSYACSGGLTTTTALPCAVCSITKKPKSL